MSNQSEHPPSPPSDPAAATSNAALGANPTQTASVHRLDNYLHTHPECVGPYRIVEVIGEGGMGVVYKAEQRAPIARVVALKLIKLGMDTKEVVGRFEAERQALAVMDHPSVAKVYDAGATDNGRPYFVMEYVAGEPLTDYCDKHKLTVKQRLEVFAQVCDAVQHAHSKGIIHRDLKPSNVLVTLRDGVPVPKVIDFGIAKATQSRLTERTVFTETGRMIGTPEYMSPEQAEMSGLDVDTRTDIYSLGVLLYELLTGALPFDRKSLRAAAYAEVQRIVREQDPPPPSTRLSSLGGAQRDGVAAARRIGFEELARQLRRELEWIPLKAMRKDRTERYRTASELADDVRNYLAGHPLIAAPESAWYRLRKTVRRHRGPVAAASAVALALLAGLAVSTVLAVRLKRTADAEVHQRELALAETARKSAVLTFLTDTIGRVRTAGGDVTLANILGEAAKALDAGRGFRDQPDLEAEIRLSVGQSYQALADHAPAEAQTLAALAIRRRLYGEHHPAYAAALNELAVVLAAQGRLDDAEQRLREAIVINRSHPAAKPAELAGNLSNLAMVLHEQDGKQAQAEQAYNEALRICRGLGDNERVATVLNNLGDLLRTAGRMNEAQQHLTEAVRLRRQLLGPRHPDLAKSLNNLALVLRSRNRLDETEPLYREALTIERGVWGPAHPAVLTDQFNLGAMLREQERLDEAEPILREVVQLRRKTIGPEHKDLAASVNALGDLLRGQGRLDEAEPLILEGLSMRRKLAGPDDASVGTSLLTLAMLRRDQMRLDEAQRAARDAMRILEQKRRPGHYLRALGASVLGEILGRGGRFDEAQPLLLTGFNELQQNGDASAARRREAIVRLVALYESWGKSDETDRWRDVLRDFDRDHRPARPATRTVVAPTTTAGSVR